MLLDEIGRAMNMWVTKNATAKNQLGNFKIKAVDITANNVHSVYLDVQPV